MRPKRGEFRQLSHCFQVNFFRASAPLAASPQDLTASGLVVPRSARRSPMGRRYPSHGRGNRHSGARQVAPARLLPCDFVEDPNGYPTFALRAGTTAQPRSRSHRV